MLDTGKDNQNSFKENIMITDDKIIQRGDSVLAFKAGFWYTMSSFLGKAITLITTPIFARLMTVSEYGEFTNFAQWAVTILIFTGLELPQTLSKAYYDFKTEYDNYISTITIFGCGITMLVYVFFLLFPGTIFKLVSIPGQYVHLLFVFVTFTFCQNVFNARERTLYRYKRVAEITFVGLFFPTLISILLVYLLPNTNHLSARLYGFYIPYSLIGMYCALKLFKKGTVFWLRYCRYAVSLSIPLLFHSLAAYLLNSTNIMITKGIMGSGAAAIVSIATSTTHIFTVFSLSVSGALTTWLMDNLELKKVTVIRSGTLYYVGILAFIVIFSILFGPEIIYFFGGEKYAASLGLLPAFLFAAFVQSVTAVFIIILTYDKSVIKTAVYTGILSVICVAAKITLLQNHELIVLAYVNIIVFGILFFINYFLVKNVGYADVINFKGVLSIILLTAVFTVGIPFIYEDTVFRYSLIIVLLMLIIVVANKNQKKIIEFANRIKKRSN